MSASAGRVTVRRIGSVMWFPVIFAIALPFVFEFAFHSPQPHQVPIAVVGSARQIGVVRAELHAVNSAGFDVQRYPSRSLATDAVRNRLVAAAYVTKPSSIPQLYVARAASAISANYLQQVFADLAAQARTTSPQTVDLVPLLPGDSGTGIFFYAFPMVMVGVITVLVMLLRAPTWSIGNRMIAVVLMGVIGAATAYITAVNLSVLPNKLVLLLCAFVLTQIVGQLLVGLAPLAKQYFLPIVMTFVLIFSVPSAGATMMPDLLPAVFRYLSNVLPLAQAVKITRSVAYFGGADTLAPILISLVWIGIAFIVIGFAQRSANHHVTSSAVTNVNVVTSSVSESSSPATLAKS
jgi:hypothetical protein